MDDIESDLGFLKAIGGLLKDSRLRRRGPPAPLGAVLGRSMLAVSSRNRGTIGAGAELSEAPSLISWSSFRR